MSEKTEPPTGRKISEARAEGQVARSHELNAAVALLVGAWLMRNGGGRLIAELKNLIVYSLSVLPTVDFNGLWLQNLVIVDLRQLYAGLSLLLFGMLFTGITVTLLQTGLLWAHKRLGIHLNRLDPIAGLKRLFSLNGWVELLKALFKLFVVGWVAYGFLRSHAMEILSLIQMDFQTAVQHWVGLALSLAIRVGLAYMVLAFADYAYQRWQHKKSLMMTREEVKEDMKRSEGDPFIRSRIRSQQRRIARMRMMANVKKSDVVITNPTHLAVAIYYDAEKMNAPKVLAKGAYLAAERIVSLARQHNVPVIQNIPIARALYKMVDIDQEIPPQLYAALAEVLAYVYRLKGKFKTS